VRGLTRLEFDCLCEAGVTCVPGARDDRADFTDAEQNAFNALETRGLIIKYGCDACGARHARLTYSGRFLLDAARLPESGIIQCDPSP
jgi:hypothetical protein